MEAKDLISSGKEAFSILRELDRIRRALGPFRPDVKSLLINYRDRSSEMKTLIHVPDDLRRELRDVEIPAYEGYVITETFDAESMNRLEHPWLLQNGKWILDPTRLPRSEKYFVIMKGRVGSDILKQLVAVTAPSSPRCYDDRDAYWIHSAIRDPTILEKIWADLEVEDVSVDVRVGVERSFASGIPKDVRRALEAERDIMRAISSGDRDEEARAKYRYRLATRTTRVTHAEIYQTVSKLVSGEIFRGFVTVDPPYELCSIAPTQMGTLIPEKVAVGVETDLNLKRQAAQGTLLFMKKQFADKVSQEFKGLVK